MKWATNEMLDAALNYLRDRVTGYHVTLSPVTDFSALAAASLATGTASVSAPANSADGGRQVVVTCQPSTVAVGFGSDAPLHLSLVSGDRVEYVTNITFPITPAMAGETLNVTPWTISFGRGV